MPTKIDTLIVGAGMSGRIAKLLRPDAMLIEASPKDKFRCALFAGPTALYERVEVLNPDRYDIVMGWCPDGWSEDARDLPFRIRPLTVGAARGSTVKKLPWERIGGGGLDHLLQKAMSDRRLPHRMQFRREGWNAKIPEIDDIRWNVRATAVDLDRQIVVLSDGGEYQYEKLIATSPLTTTMKMCGMELGSGDLISAALHYKRESVGYLWPVPRGQMYVEYVPHVGTSVFRRTLYVEPNGWAEQSWESVEPIDRGTPFWPGVIKASMAANRVVACLEERGVHPAGRFARWDPDEHLHNTEDRLRRLLK